MDTRCIIIPAIKKNAVIPDQLVKKLAGVTLIERGIGTARDVCPPEDVYVLTDSQEIELICERAGVGCRRNKDLKFTTLNIVAEMRDVLGELAQKYEHCIVLRASCPLLTWVDVEDAWHKYLEAGADSLVTVKSVHQRIWGVQGRNLEHLLDEAEGEREIVVESRALIILRSEALLSTLASGYAARLTNVVPYFLNDRAIEIQSYQDWWICEHLLLQEPSHELGLGLFHAVVRGDVHRVQQRGHAGEPKLGPGEDRLGVGQKVHAGAAFFELREHRNGAFVGRKAPSGQQPECSCKLPDPGIQVCDRWNFNGFRA